MSLRDLQGRTWAIVGASSALARAYAHTVAVRGASVILIGRDSDDLTRTAVDLKVRYGITATVDSCELADRDSVALLVQRLKPLAAEGRLDLFFAAGVMLPQSAIEADPKRAAEVIEVNLTAPMTVLLGLAPAWEAAKSGTVVVVGSVAGDRGRLGNHVYGATKAGLATFTAGLRNRLARSGVHVLTVKPGFLDTAMTWGLPGVGFAADPSKVSGTILAAALNRVDVAYVPWIWWGIMTIIAHIPEAIFKRLKI